MQVDELKGGAPAPDETAADTAALTSEEASKTNENLPVETETDEADAPQADGEGEAAKTAEKPVAEKPKEQEAEAKADDPKEETRSQRKRRLRRERDDEQRAELDRVQRELDAANRRLSALKDIDPNKAEDYDKAITTNIVNGTLRAQEAARLEALQSDKARIEAESKEAAGAAWREQVAELSHITDYAQKVYDPDVPFTNEIVAAVTQMERGPEIAYALANDHDRLRRLQRLNPVQLGAELARIEAGLTLPKPKKTTSAPAPLKPLKGSSAPPDPNLETADMKTYEKLRGYA